MEWCWGPTEAGIHCAAGECSFSRNMWVCSITIQKCFSPASILLHLCSSLHTPKARFETYEGHNWDKRKTKVLEVQIWDVFFRKDCPYSILHQVFFQSFSVRATWFGRLNKHHPVIYRKDRIKDSWRKIQAYFNYLLRSIFSCSWMLCVERPPPTPRLCLLEYTKQVAAAAPKSFIILQPFTSLSTWRECFIWDAGDKTLGHVLPLSYGFSPKTKGVLKKQNKNLPSLPPPPWP